ncbi:MAG: hypothetical protein E7B11_12870 [Clostridiales bacterium]|nr:hypothetical protein [Clostridiales bacterium]MDU3241450.1 hypothetical protein [Clostridiales bacterium]
MLIILQVLLCIFLILWILILISYIINHFDFPFHYPECKLSSIDIEILEAQKKRFEIEKDLEDRRNWKTDKSKYYVSGKPWEKEN